MIVGGYDIPTHEFFGMCLQVSEAVPQNEVWMYTYADGVMKVHKMVNIGSETEALSLCAGEMK